MNLPSIRVPLKDLTEVVKPKPAAQPQTHDYTRRCYGHDYSIRQAADGGTRLRMTGWGVGIVAGDYLILRNGDGTTRYQVEQIDYCNDPRDMWFADVAFAPRQAVS
jgi:hypothetical protein